MDADLLWASGSILAVRSTHPCQSLVDACSSFGFHHSKAAFRSLPPISDSLSLICHQHPLILLVTFHYHPWNLLFPYRTLGTWVGTLGTWLVNRVVPGATGRSYQSVGGWRRIRMDSLLVGLVVSFVYVAGAVARRAFVGVLRGGTVLLTTSF